MGKIEKKSSMRRETKCTVPIKMKSGKTKMIPAPKLRSSLKYGTVCILLAGPYKGKRVVMLKGLPSGNIVVTGPYSVNGIPLRRANPRFVLATSTVLPIKELDLSGFDDAYFKKPSKTVKAESIFAESEATAVKKESTKKRTEAEKFVDIAVVKALRSDEALPQYMKTRFSLRDRMYPHALKF